MLRQLVTFHIISYFDYVKGKEVEQNLIDTLDIIQTLYADEWCLQLINSDIKEARKNKDLYPARGIWLFHTSRTTLDTIMEYFDDVEPNSRWTYYIEIPEP